MKTAQNRAFTSGSLAIASTLLALAPATASAGTTGTPPREPTASTRSALSGTPSAATLSAHLEPSSDRDAAQRLFYDTLLPLTDVPVGWTGSVAGCRAGTVSPAAHAAMLNAVNLFRSMVGLPSVTTDASFDELAQQAALMMKAEDDLSHYPGPRWACHSAAGAQGAGRSNLYLGVTGADAIWGYMEDSGANNTEAGHRQWILDPLADRFGIGATDGSHALLVVAPRRPAPESPLPEWLPWPIAGASSVGLEPGGRWSLGATDPETSFDSAAITVHGPTGPMTVTRNTGAGARSLVWQVKNLPDPEEMQHDATYRVAVTGLTRRGAALPPVEYSVTLVALRTPTATRNPTLTGNARPGGRLTVDVGAWPEGTRTQVELLRNGKPIEIWGSTYMPDASDVGAEFSARVTASRGNYRDTVMTTQSVRVTAPAKALTLVRKPAITGTAKVGARLSATPGTWSPKPTRIAFAWYRGSTAIKGATKPTYTVARADRGHRLTVRAVASRPGWTTTTATSTSVRVR